MRGKHFSGIWRNWTARDGIEIGNAGDWKDSIFQIDMARQALHESRLVFNSGRTMQSGTPHITIDNHNLGIQAGKDGAQIYGCRRLSFARQSTGDQQELGYRACREYNRCPQRSEGFSHLRRVLNRRSEMPIAVRMNWD